MFTKAPLYRLKSKLRFPQQKTAYRSFGWHTPQALLNRSLLDWSEGEFWFFKLFVYLLIFPIIKDIHVWMGGGGFKQARVPFLENEVIEPLTQMMALGASLELSLLFHHLGFIWNLGKRRRALMPKMLKGKQRTRGKAQRVQHR